MTKRLHPFTFSAVLASSLFLATACAQAQSDQAAEAPGEETVAPAEPDQSLTPEEEFALTDPEQAPREPSEEAKAALAMIGAALKKIDEEIEPTGNNWQFQLGEHIVLVVTDPIAERMRIMIPIVPAEQLGTELLQRLMQANFDSALDARYGIAQNLLWGTYIHPLTSLEEAEFLSGLSQTVAIVKNFGTSFSSGAAVFGGGDSQGIIEDQLEELIREREKANNI
ncbi:MAG: hypothetical protein AAGE37_10195 [Pseudomonadota bacterium]